ncbi:Hpt domain-containing protein [Roseovarius sp. D0-M9]|uniref:Hpt domain-containing protein n=1 Tax=Roseovarius sp. D0-M9 TaxID=3127117 RepID=UPI0030101CA6
MDEQDPAHQDERNSAHRDANRIRDLDAFADASDVFGPEAAMAHLRLFGTELEQHLSWIERGTPDLQALQDMAHRTAGRAGVLGFPSLANASANLDEASGLNAGVTAALDHWTWQARRAAEIAARETDQAALDANTSRSDGPDN